MSKVKEPTKDKLTQEELNAINWGWNLSSDRVAVLPMEEKVSVGGIIIPETAEKILHEGYIICLGDKCGVKEDGTQDRSYPLFIGQRVKYGKYSGTEMKGEDGKEYMIMREADIAGYKVKK